MIIISPIGAVKPTNIGSCDMRDMPKIKLIIAFATEIKTAHFLMVEPIPSIFISPKIKNAHSLKPYAKNAGLKLLCGTKKYAKTEACNNYKIANTSFIGNIRLCRKGILTYSCLHCNTKQQKTSKSVSFFQKRSFRQSSHYY